MSHTPSRREGQDNDRDERRDDSAREGAEGGFGYVRRIAREIRERREKGKEWEPGVFGRKLADQPGGNFLNKK
jgi:hypothetical protein